MGPILVGLLIKGLVAQCGMHCATSVSIVYLVQV